MRCAKIRWPRSLRGRLQAVFVAGMALSAGLVAIGVLVLAEPFSRHMLRGAIEAYTDAIAGHVRFDAAGLPTGVDETRIQRWLFTSFGEEVLFRILDDRGRVRYAFDPNARPLTPDGEDFDPRRRGFTLTHGGVGMHGSTAALAHAGRRWYVQFATSDRLVLQMRRSFAMPALGQGVAVTCATFLVVFLVTMHFTLRRTLEPLRAASDAARRITPRTLDARLDVATQPIEIRPLVDGFNQVLDRLQQGFRTQQEFLSSAAHELKTPLALIRAQVELGPPNERRRLLLQDVDRMAHQVQQLLLLAEVSEPQNFRIESIDPRPTIHDAFDHMARLADQHSVLLGLRIDDGLRQWHADRGALFTLLKNLLENAIQHSPVGGVVSLSASAGGFSVVDQGSGVAAEDLSRMFDRFWRSPQRRDTGAGLGLAICREITATHGWRLQALRRDQGLEVRAAMDVSEDGPTARSRAATAPA